MIVDVSEWQGTIDWNAVKVAGVTFAWIKATEGVGWEDPKFQTNWAAIKAAGIGRGAYHFARPDIGASTAHAIQEADYFLSVVPLQPGDQLAWDTETGSGDLNNYTYQALSHIRAQTLVSPFLYASYFYILSHLTEPALTEFLLWCADYQNSEPTPPPPWNSIALWQYTSSGAISGIAGRVDLDSPGIYNTSGSGTLEANMDWIYGFTAWLLYPILLGRKAANGEETVWRDLMKKQATANQDVIGPVIGGMLASSEGVAWMARLQWLHDNLTVDAAGKVSLVGMSAPPPDVDAPAFDPTALTTQVQAAQASADSALQLAQKVESAIKTGAAALGNA